MNALPMPAPTVCMVDGKEKMARGEANAMARRIPRAKAYQCASCGDWHVGMLPGGKFRKGRR